MSKGFDIVSAGSATPNAPQPTSPKGVPHRGGPVNPSAEALRARFPQAVKRVDVVWGETTVYVAGEQVLEIARWLHDDPAQRYDYLSDVTAVDYRDGGQALAAQPEARYSMEELSIADAFEDLPADMRKRLQSGQKTGE